MRRLPCKFVTSHQTDAANQIITIVRPVDSTEVYTVSYPTTAGFLAVIDLRFARGSNAGLTDQVLLAILIDRLEHRLEHAPDGNTADKAWQAAIQCLMMLPSQD